MTVDLGGHKNERKVSGRCKSALAEGCVPEVGNNRNM